MSRYTDEERREDSLQRQLERGRQVLAEMERVAALVAEHLTAAEISTRLAVSRRTVRRRLGVLMVLGRAGASGADVERVLRAAQGRW